MPCHVCMRYTVVSYINCTCLHHGCDTLGSHSPDHVSTIIVWSCVTDYVKVNTCSTPLGETHQHEATRSVQPGETTLVGMCITYVYSCVYVFLYVYVYANVCVQCTCACTCIYVYMHVCVYIFRDSKDTVGTILRIVLRFCEEFRGLDDLWFAWGPGCCLLWHGACPDNHSRLDFDSPNGFSSILRMGCWFYESARLVCVYECFWGFHGFREWVSRVPRMGLSSSFFPSPWGIICFIPGMFNRIVFLRESRPPNSTFSTVSLQSPINKYTYT